MRLRVATCHFPVDADIRRNLKYVVRHIRAASDQGARVAHFPEACLSGYAGIDFNSFRGFDWSLLESSTKRILELAGQLGTWVVLGSSHRLTGKHKPHDSVYVISNWGEIVDRYDKMFCGGPEEETENDPSHYTPGHHFTCIDLLGVRSGVLICYDYAFTELYREYKRKGVQLMFHSFHAGRASPKLVRQMLKQGGSENAGLNRASNGPEIRTQAAVQAAAHANHIWVSCSNTSARENSFPSFFRSSRRRDYRTAQENTAGVLVTTIDTDRKPPDPSAPWREGALKGVFSQRQAGQRPAVQ